MKKIYNVTLFSNIPTTGTLAEAFYFDWSQIEDVPYKVTFTFQAAGSAIQNSAVIQVFVDLGQGNTSFIAQSQTAPATYKTGFLGSLMINGVGADNFYYSYIPNNPPVLIYHRPPNNNFTVGLYTNVPPFNDSLLPPGGYTLILNFETLD